MIAGLRQKMGRELAFVAGAGVLLAVVIAAVWTREFGTLGPGFWPWLGSLVAALCGGVLSMATERDSREP